ncbi:MAG: methyltransferase domain-containing protein [Planctomycetes bacterium]|nr:methyltransferase domain-containing protein [Planctomycetota bacterium]
MEREEIERNLVSSRRTIWLRRRKIRRVFARAPRSGSILEVGCGDGLNLPLLRALGHCPVFGMDISALLLKRCPDRYDGVFIGDACLAGIRSESLDNIFVDSVLHHVDVSGLVREAARILRPGGHLAFCEPSGGAIWRGINLLGRYALRHVSSLFRQRDENVRLERTLHETWFSRIPEMEGILAESGFEVTYWRKGALNVMCLARKAGVPLTPSGGRRASKPMGRAACYGTGSSP